MSSWLRYSLLISVSATLLSSAASAQTINRKHPISFDSGYVNSLQTNRSVGDFNIEMMELYGFASESLYNYDIFQSPENRLAGNLYLVGNVLIGSIVAEGMGLAYHEFGHGSRFQALGITSGYRIDDQRVSGSGYFPLFGASMLNPASGGATFSKGQKFIPKTSENLVGTVNVPALGLSYPTLTPKANLIISAAGVNNEMQMAHHISEHIHDKGGTIFMLPFYLENKLGNLDYRYKHESGNDMRSIQTSYDQMGRKINNRDLRMGNWIALLGSQTTWAFFRGVEFQTWEYRDFRLPDLDFFVNSQGISMKMYSHYRLDETSRIPFAIEQVYKGKEATEITVGYEKTFVDLSNLKLRGDLLLGPRGQGVMLSGDYPFLQNMSVKAGYTYYDFHTLHGERNIPSLKHGQTDHEIWAKYSFWY